MPRNLLLAVGIILFGFVSFDLMGVIVRTLGDDYPILQLSALRNMFGILPSMILMWRGGIFAQLAPLNRPVFHVIALLRAAAVLLAQICFYTALTKIEFATATALAYAGPFFIAGLSVPLLGQKVGIWRWSAIITGFVGVIAILRPFNDDFSIYMLFPVIAAFGYALSSILVRFYPDDISSAAIQMSQQVYTMILSTLFLFLFSAPVGVATPMDAGLFVLMGVFGGVGVLCIVVSYRLADPSAVSPFEYFGIPMSFLLGWLFFSEAPYGTLFPGVLLIIGAGVLIIWRERHQSAVK